MKKESDFNVTLTCRHQECSDNLKEFVIRQLNKLSRYSTNIIAANVTIDKQNSIYIVDISLQLTGTVINAKQEDYDKTKALDIALEKVKTQVMKLKSKVVDHRTPPQPDIVEVENNRESDNLE